MLFELLVPDSPLWRKRPACAMNRFILKCNVYLSLLVRWLIYFYLTHLPRFCCDFLEQVEVLLIDLLNPNASISLLLLLLMTSLNIKLIFINPFIFFFLNLAIHGTSGDCGWGNRVQCVGLLARYFQYWVAWVLHSWQRLWLQLFKADRQLITLCYFFPTKS